MNSIDKLKKVFESKDNKVLLENFISLTLLQVVGYLLPLLTLPYIARTIGVENFGVVAFAAAIIVFFQAFTDYGFNYTAIRDVAKVRDNKKEVSKIFSVVIFTRFFLAFVSFFILLVLINLIPKFNQNAQMLLYTFLLIPGYVMYPEWFFQAIEKMKYSALLTTVIKLGFTMLVFIFIKEKEDYIYIPLLNAVNYVLIGGVSFYVILVKYKYSLLKVKFKEIKDAIKKSTDVFISLILPNLYTNLSTIFLGSFWGKAPTGIFDAGSKFSIIGQQAINVLSRAFFPYLSRKIDKHQVYAKISLSISVVMCFILFFCAEFIIGLFYDSSYEESILVVKILSISPVFLSLMNVYGTNFLVIKGQEKILRNIYTVNSILGVFISYFLVKEFSYIGAALTIVLIRALIGVSCLFYARKIN